MMWMSLFLIATCLRLVRSASTLVDYPWVGTLSFIETRGRKHMCNTILVVPDMALTAAECVLLEPLLNSTKQIPWSITQAWIVMGVEDYLNCCNPDSQRQLVINASLHKNATFGRPAPFENQYNIALLKLEKTFNMTATVNVMYPITNEDEFIGHVNDIVERRVHCEAVGWELKEPLPKNDFSGFNTHLETAPVLFYNATGACNLFLPFSRTQCLAEMNKYNINPFSIPGGVAGGAIGASVACVIEGRARIFAMITGPLTGCPDYNNCEYDGIDENWKKKPMLINGIGHKTLKDSLEIALDFNLDIRY